MISIRIFFISRCRSILYEQNNIFYIMYIHTNHYSGRYRIPFQPKGDKRRCDQNYSRNKNRRKIKCTISCKHEVDFQATVIIYIYICDNNFPPHKWKGNHFMKMIVAAASKKRKKINKFI